MKRILFVLAIGLSACNSQTKETTVTDTIATVKNIDTIKKDTVKIAPVKEKSEEEKADERLNKIMKNRKNVK